MRRRAVPARVIGAETRPDRDRRAGRRRRPRARSSRSSACSSEARRVSQPEPPCRRTRAPASSRRSGSSRLRSAGCSSTVRSTHASPRPRDERAARPDGRPRLLRQRGVLRRLRVRAAARLTALRDSISLTVYYGAKLDLRRLDRDRAVAVGPHARRARVRDAGAPGRRVHRRGHERARLGARGARPRRCCRSRPARSSPSRRRRRTSTSSAALALLAAHAGRARQRVRGRDRGVADLIEAAPRPSSSGARRRSPSRSPRSGACS